MTGDIETVLRSLVREEVDRALAAKPKEPVAPTYVTIAEFANRRAISISTVRQAIREGRLPAKKLDRAVRIPATAEILRSRDSQTTEDAKRAARSAKLLGFRRRE